MKATLDPDAIDNYHGQRTIYLDLQRITIQQLQVDFNCILGLRC
jgi:hypothetical protein